MDREKVIKGLEQFKADLKPFCGNRADWERFDAGLALLKEQEANTPSAGEIAEEMVNYICEHEKVVRCKDCKKYSSYDCHITSLTGQKSSDDWFCADGELKK